MRRAKLRDVQGNASDSKQQRVLLVSKPVHAPFHDGSQVLVREIANQLRRFTPTVMGTGERHGFAAHVRVERTYPRHGAFAPQLQQNLRPMWRLLRGPDVDVWHFVFAPNLRSCRAIRALRQFKTRPTVQTIASPPRSFEGVEQLLFGDAIVAQSEWTAEQVRAHWGARVDVIRPPVSPVAVPAPELTASLRRQLDVALDAELVTYPGDLEFSGGAERVAAMVEPLVQARPNVIVVFACRHKTPAAAGVLQQLKARLDPSKVRFAGELPSLPVLLGTSRLVVFPAAQLFAKVDIPFALLEAMSLGIPLVVPEEGPVAELTSAVRVPLQDNAAWVRSSSELLSQAPMWEMIRTRQRVQLESEFAAKVVAARYEDLYQRVLG